MKDIRHKTKQGIQAGVFGLFLNLGLALMKLMGGFLSKSQALVADGINSFFDSLSALITIIGLKVSLKPEDFDHPYGHSRFEYIAGFMISLIMAVVGFDVLKQSIQGILNPSILLLSPASFIIVFTSFTLKGILVIYYHKQYKLTGIKILKASKQDSFNDLLMSFSILFGFVVYHLFNIKVDAYLALAFSFVILYQSYKTISQFVNELIGKDPRPLFWRVLRPFLMKIHRFLVIMICWFINMVMVIFMPVSI